MDLGEIAQERYWVLVTFSN